ncbi:cell envelope integrity protein TolA [Flammeovirga sp. EKP202]|uniref:cell envelope integrity protein TolA n=1 Tax=Flammeovirga sp. EKP202 TaxID=2770592 RepID=UPI00165F6FF8|nr:cell envelope integrity protein TolA [Flammeovirga sp. EKP202]MBD0403205.1 cell envelope integrity protein TolA [Flammeovirga sp. EKP202]
MSQHQVRYLNGGLGVTADKKRRIQSGNEYDYLFPSPERSDPILHKNGSTFDTIGFMKQIVEKTKGDTLKFSKWIKKSDIQSTLHALFDFMYNHIQYQQDDPGEEQLRRPARSWSDRKTGVDCDCYSIFISSVLSNLGIPHTFRKTKYYHRSYFQHIYVVVPKFAGANMNDRKQYWTIDPVMDRFDDEKIYTGKHDLTVLKSKGMNGTGLSGVDGLLIRYMNGLNGFQPVNRSIRSKNLVCKCLLKGLDGTIYGLDEREVFYSAEGAQLQAMHGDEIVLESNGELYSPLRGFGGLGSVYGLGFFGKIWTAVKTVGGKIWKGAKSLFTKKKLTKVADVASAATGGGGKPRFKADPRFVKGITKEQMFNPKKPIIGPFNSSVAKVTPVGGNLNLNWLNKAGSTANMLSSAFGLKNTQVGQVVSQVNAKVNQLNAELNAQKQLNQTLQSASADGKLDTREILALVKASQGAGVTHDDMLKHIRSYSMKPEEVQKYADISSKRAAVAALAKGTTKEEAHKLAQLYAAEAAGKTASKEDAQLLAQLYAEQAGAKKIDLAEAQRIAKAEAKANGVSLSLSQKIAKLEAKAAMVGKATKEDVEKTAEQQAKLENAKTRLYIQKQMQLKEQEERQRADNNKNLLIMGGLAAAALVYMKMT